MFALPGLLAEQEGVSGSLLSECLRGPKNALPQEAEALGLEAQSQDLTTRPCSSLSAAF